MNNGQVGCAVCVHTYMGVFLTAYQIPFEKR